MMGYAGRYPKPLTFPSPIIWQETDILRTSHQDHPYILALGGLLNTLSIYFIGLWTYQNGSFVLGFQLLFVASSLLSNCWEVEKGDILYYPATVHGREYKNRKI